MIFSKRNKKKSIKKIFNSKKKIFIQCQPMRQVSKPFSLYYIKAIVFYTKSLAILFFKKNKQKNKSLWRIRKSNTFYIVDIQYVRCFVASYYKLFLVGLLLKLVTLSKISLNKVNEYNSLWRTERQNIFTYSSKRSSLHTLS